ncbi:DUF2145 domain-containing protein [Aquabacterium lacunae]|uniref:DUF2145 domain-containing protein n=1 Tax=Aquabacterium lacunae TaxID=2528630 RepID=A0A4Q9H180_9BURK|nr:DUF2145 domain-containing protein [Aquabacterium lacunae]TBO32942.1 DUF2145 domain-containing protein [Aquabacterium lacunae]
MSRSAWKHAGCVTWVIALACALPAAHAGRGCQAERPTVAAVQQGLGLAERTVKQLDASGAQVVVLARAGQDLRAHGLRYSHLGLAYKAPDGWRVLHKLNDCGSAQSAIYRQGVGDFFLDTPYEHVAAVVVPSPLLQQRLMPVLRDPGSRTHLHTRAYSMVAHPWAVRYQQSNQWAIELIASVMSPDVTDRASAQRWLKQAGYRPSELRVSMWSRLGARMTMANVAFDDHPNELRYSGRIQTVTVDSVFTWLQQSGLAEAEWVVR